METFTTQVYNNYPFLLFPGGRPFRYIIGSNQQSIRVFVYQKTDLFGDPQPLELMGLSIKIKVSNQQGNLIFIGNGTVVDFETSEIEYTWNQLDIINPGIYYCEFVFQDIDNSKFILPDKGSRLEVVAT